MLNTRLLSILAILGMFSTGCKDKHTETYTANVPVYKSLSEWRSEPIQMQGPRELNEPGKIYIYLDYLLVNDRLQGIHFIDNSDPANPTKIGFLPVQGNVDIAVRNDRLYIDAFTDLLTIDISNINDPKLICRSEDVFQFNSYRGIQGFDPNFPMGSIDPSKGVVVGWKQEEVSHDIGHSDPLNGFDEIGNGPVSFNGSSSNPSNVGTGGSMARFTITNDHLYTLETSELSSYNLLSGDCPQVTSEMRLNRVAETIFPARDHLFLGTTTGMLIYSLNDPGNPAFVSDYDHISACDPVVVRDNRAYVTLRTGNACFGNVNRLLVLDVSDLSNPSEITFYNMTNPHGLGIDENTLFVCDGQDGLKVFDASDDHNILQNKIAQFQQIDAYDVIPDQSVLISVAADGIYQYDYSDPANITQLSYIPAP